jgi:hypothetical protein
LQKLDTAKKSLTLAIRGEENRLRDFPDVFQKINNLPVPVENNLPANITPNEKRSLSMRGNNNALRNGFFSKRAPSMLCDNCYLVRSVMDENYKILDAADIKCPYYKPKSACVYMCQMLKVEVRELEDVKALMEGAVELDAQRIQMARAIEVYDGGGNLDQALDMGMERMMKNLDILKNMYFEMQERNKKAPDGRPGVLAQLLAGMGVVEATVEKVTDGK